ncbi:Fc.00g107930.m01.CDS01 [Cosmosporella sp. VM-42]
MVSNSSTHTRNTSSSRGPPKEYPAIRSPSETATDTGTPKNDEEKPETLLDTHNRLIADILTRYRMIMMLATIQAEGERNNANPEAIAVAGLSMKMEFEGLYSSIKELLSLSRRMKELWIFGPLGRGDPNRKAKEEQIDKDAAEVSVLLSKLEGLSMKELAEKNGGTWEPLKEGESSQSTTAPAEAATSETLGRPT